MNLTISDLQNNMNILIVNNISQALDLCYNLYSTIFLVKKSVEKFLKKFGQFPQIVIDKKVYRIVNII